MADNGLAQAIFDCIKDSDTNTFSDFEVSDGTVLDANGVLVPDGEWYGTDTDDEVVCFAKVKARIVADGETGTATNGDYASGDTVFTVPGYGEICIPSKDIAQSDVIFQAGETYPEGAPEVILADGSLLLGGEEVPVGQLVMFDGDESACLTKPAPIDAIKTEGEVIAAGTVVTDDSVDPALLDENGALLADYTVQAGESFIVDGDEACSKSPSSVPFTCENDPDFDNAQILRLGDQAVRFSASLDIGQRFNFVGNTLSGQVMLDSNNAVGDTFEGFLPWPFTINDCTGSGCISYRGSQQHFLAPNNTISDVNINIAAEYAMCDSDGNPVDPNTGAPAAALVWQNHGTGGTMTAHAEVRPEESLNMEIGGRICFPNGDYQMKLRLRLVSNPGTNEDGWELRAQNNSIDSIMGVILRCCPLDTVDPAPLKAPENTVAISTEADAPLA